MNTKYSSSLPKTSEEEGNADDEMKRIRGKLFQDLFVRRLFVFLLKFFLFVLILRGLGALIVIMFSHYYVNFYYKVSVC